MLQKSGVFGICGFFHDSFLGDRRYAATRGLASGFRSSDALAVDRQAHVADVAFGEGGYWLAKRGVIRKIKIVSWLDRGLFCIQNNRELLMIHLK
jgi:hypothetical protein